MDQRSKRHKRGCVKSENALGCFYRHKACAQRPQRPAAGEGGLLALGSLKTLSHIRPVDDLPDLTHIVRAHILVLQQGVRTGHWSTGGGAGGTWR